MVSICSCPSARIHADWSWATEVVLSTFLTSFSFELSDSETPIVWNSSSVNYPTMGEESKKPEMLLKMKVL